MRRNGSIVGVMLVVASTLAVAEPPESWHGKVLLELVGRRGTQTFVHECWVKGDQVRVKQLEPGQQVWVTDGDKAFELSFGMSQAIGIAKPGRMWQLKIGRLIDTPYFQDTIEEPEKEKIGQEEIDGIACTIYEYEVEFKARKRRGRRGGTSQVSVKEWRDTARDVVIKAEVDTGSTTQIISISDIEVNPSLESGFFAPPKGMTIAEPAQVGGMAPAFALKTVEGEEVKLSDYLGKKVLMVNIFGTWCGPCRSETPGFVDVYEEYKEKGVEFISVALERGDPKKTVPAFQKKFGVEWPIVVNGMGGSIRGLYPGNSVPRNAIINKNGEIIYYRPGGMRESKLKQLLDEALGVSD